VCVWRLPAQAELSDMYSYDFCVAFFLLRRRSRYTQDVLMLGLCDSIDDFVASRHITCYILHPSYTKSICGFLCNGCLCFATAC